MTRIFADANVWLDLYQSAKTGDRLEVFADLARVAARFVFTQQLTEEILRNRGRILNELAQKYRKPALDFPVTAIVEQAPDFEAFNLARKSLHVASAKVADYLEHVRDDGGDDPVLGALTALFIADGSLVLAYDDDLIDRANRRRLTGQPPGTSSGTLGDELHWEIMLANLRGEDLLIVSRDTSFSKHFSLLATEFNAKTSGNLIAIEESLGGALRRAELAVPDSVREVEEAIRAGLHVDPNRWHLLSTRGDIGIVTDGRFTGATPLNDHDRMRCPICGAPGPWNGARCLTCGNMSYD
ncbi:MAG: PIN domain-containing protein [Desulfuromonadales bacterium]